MAISKKLRFEVFKRDAFTCQYCGKTPPDTTLEVDHIIPKSRKGTDDINNLVTSCFDCNRGKSNIELTKLPNKIGLNYEILKEKEIQYREYVKLVKRIEKRLMIEVEEVTEIYELHFSQYTLSEKFKSATIRMFLKKLDVVQVMESMQKACSYIEDPDESIRYFCGICWNKIREKENGI